MRYDLTPLQGSYITMANGLAARLRNDAQDALDRAHGLRKQAEAADKLADNFASQADLATVSAVRVVAKDLGVERDGWTSMLFPGPKGIPSALELEWPPEPQPEAEPDPVAVPVVPPKVEASAAPEPVDDRDQGQPF